MLISDNQWSIIFNVDIRESVINNGWKWIVHLRELLLNPHVICFIINYGIWCSSPYSELKRAASFNLTFVYLITLIENKRSFSEPRIFKTLIPTFSI